jgi:hypothetical protein
MRCDMEEAAAPLGLGGFLVGEPSPTAYAVG